MRKTLFFLAGSLGLIGPAFSLGAWDAQALLDVLPTAALVQTSLSSPWMQSETTEVTAQGALSHSQPLVEGLSLTGTIWGMADSLPSQSPLSTPAAKIDLKSRILELKLVWEAIPRYPYLGCRQEGYPPFVGFFSNAAEHHFPWSSREHIQPYRGGCRHMGGGMDRNRPDASRRGFHNRQLLLSALTVVG